MKKILALGASILVLGAHAACAEEYVRMHMSAPIYFSTDGDDVPPETGTPLSIVLQGTTALNAAAGQHFSYGFSHLATVSDSTIGADDLDWSVDEELLPPGLALQGSTILGYPAAGSGDKDYSFEIVASHADAEEPGRATYTISVAGMYIPVSKISSGYTHNCAITLEDEVICWGRNQNGQLGNNASTDTSTPVYVRAVGGAAGSRLTGVKALSLGHSHSCAITSSDQVVCWGYNVEGYLGNGNSTTTRSPVYVLAVGGAAGSRLSGVSAIAAGVAHNCAITSGSGVVCWGGGSFGRHGNGGRYAEFTPVRTNGLNGSGFLTDATRIEAGAYFTCADTTSNGVVCWGQGTQGALGNADSVDESYPRRVREVSGAGYLGNVTDLSATGDSICALSVNSGAVCWGANAAGQLGDGTTTNRNRPVQVLDVGGAAGSQLSGATKISAASGSACAIRTGGAVVCWGNGTNIGSGGSAASRFPIPVWGIDARDATSQLAGISTMSSGENHHCAIGSAASVGTVCWGFGSYGALGKSDLVIAPSPIRAGRI